ncbi:hypothetical protein BJX61DRAFT_38213 [Aspergillus egyptiacus]|nr:hypothetical protein BJX61DRAFT_38213 [Aspergillus egyptiacus]
MADVDAGDRILCHACGRVWPRSQHGLECPYCGSDFTEIVRPPNRHPGAPLTSQIEIPPDTDPEPQPSSHPDPPETFPGHRSHSPPAVNPWADHDPWRHMHDDYDDDDNAGWGSPRVSQRTYQSPSGNFMFHSTIRTHGLPPRRPSGAGGEDSFMLGLNSFFSSITELNRERAARAQPRSPGHDHNHDDSMPGHPPPFHHPGGGLFPRDADGPQPMASPLRSLGDILQLFHTNIGNMDPGHAQAGAPNVRIMAQGTPMALLSALLNVERNGDAVYSQGELDRIISELLETNGQRTAVPPAPQDAIRSLPKKSADESMLGGDQAECSICMDSVKIGDEVTVLPCTHWFHPQCIELWLNQHNTCPHCRRSINQTPATAPSEGTSDQTRHSDGEQASSHASRANRGEGSGGWTGWVRSRLGGGS